MFDEACIDVTHPPEAFKRGLRGGERGVLQRINAFILSMTLSESENVSKVFEFVGEPRALVKVECDAGFAQAR